MKHAIDKFNIYYLYNELEKIDWSKASSFIEEWKKRRNRYSSSHIIKIATSNLHEYIYLLEESWKIYLEGFQYMDLLYPFIKRKRFLYPKKTKVLFEFVNSFTSLNEIVYSLGMAEKGVIESVVDKWNIDIKNIPLPKSSAYLYLNELANTLFERIDPNLLANKQYVRLKIYEDSIVRKAFNNYSFGSLDNFIYLLKKLKNLRSTGRKVIPNRNLYYSSLPKLGIIKIIQKLLLYDHRWELEYRYLDIVNLDLPFYLKLSEILNTKETIQNILTSLKTLHNEQMKYFYYKIPYHYQNGPTCGVSCLLNTLSTFANIKVNKQLEKEIFKKVVVPGTVNNLPTCLALVAQQDYGLTVKFIVDWIKYKLNFINNPKFKNDPRVFKLLECKKKIKTIEKRNLMGEEVIDYLRNGYMLSMVGEVGNVNNNTEIQPENILHYRLIYGYEKKDEEFEYLIFDPLKGKFKTNDLSTIIFNRYGMWGVAVGSRDIPILESIEKKYIPAVYRLINKFNSFYFINQKKVNSSEGLV
jgi:hypothetical protein